MEIIIKRLLFDVIVFSNWTFSYFRYLIIQVNASLNSTGRPYFLVNNPITKPKILVPYSLSQPCVQHFQLPNGFFPSVFPSFNLVTVNFEIS